MSRVQLAPNVAGLGEAPDAHACGTSRFDLHAATR